MSSQKTSIPVNIIGGPLGSGKTTTINHLLSQKDPNEYWAILINEYGLIGIDGALIENTSKKKRRYQRSRGWMYLLQRWRCI